MRLNARVRGVALHPDDDHDGVPRRPIDIRPEHGQRCKGVGAMKIEYLHASKYGNGVKVAEEFKKQMAASDVAVDIHHIRQARPDRLPAADLYVFSSPGRIGKPIGEMRRFLKKVRLPAGTRYALLTTEAAPQPDKQTGRMPAEEEIARWQRVRPIMNEILHRAGLVKIAEDKVYVTSLKGPLEDGWEQKVATFAARVQLKV
jgi:menaquinone-dependent protoporphyrinogen IX oxidase